MRGRRTSTGLVALALGLVGVGSGCGKSDTSIALVFPNAVSQQAVRRLRVEAYAPNTGGAAASDRDCNSFVDLARQGKDPLGTPTRGDYTCVDTEDARCAEDWFDGKELLKIEPGRQIIYVLAYAETEDGATPILDGCTDRFDSGGSAEESLDVPVYLQLVVPDSARLVIAGGDRQVGRAGQEVAAPLTVRAEADAPNGAGGTYVIPGVTVRYSAVTPGYTLPEGNGDTLETYTDVDGLARARVTLPLQAGSGRIQAFAPELEEWVPDGRDEVTFSLSVTEPVSFSTGRVLQTGTGVRPMEVAIGYLDAGLDPDVVMLGCRGTEAGCVRGAGAAPPFGEAVLTVLQDLRAGARSVPVVGEQGILPNGLAVADIAPAAGVDEIALVNARLARCQDRTCPANGECKCFGVPPGGPCPCEGSEVRVFALEGAQVVLRSRHTLTASNAVGLTAVKSNDYNPYLGLAVVAQGRANHTRPCSQANRCLPYEPAVNPACEGAPEQCGCPVEERCECPGCASTQVPGMCVARDKLVDLLVPDSLTRELFNRGGCQRPLLECNPISSEASSCTCQDSNVTENRCSGQDGCSCKAPDRIYVGDDDSPVMPLGIASGPVDNAGEWDIVVPSISGLEFIEAKGGGGRLYKWKGEAIINPNISRAEVVELDSEVDQNRGDLVWYARSPCLAGFNYNVICPLTELADENAVAQGCLGAYYTDGQESVFNLRPPSLGGCRRYMVDVAPDGMCTGDMNGDGHVDVVLASRDSTDLRVFAGDGRGGLLNPPQLLPLPAGGVGGPVACGDTDGDGLDDVVVTDLQTGAIYLLGTAP